MDKTMIEEDWREMCDRKISMRDIMMIALIEDILPDSAYDDAAKYILEMLLSRYHDISIESIEKLLDTYNEYWDWMLRKQPPTLW